MIPGEVHVPRDLLQSSRAHTCRSSQGFRWPTCAVSFHVCPTRRASGRPAAPIFAVDHLFWEDVSMQCECPEAFDTSCSKPGQKSHRIKAAFSNRSARCVELPGKRI